MKEFSMKEVSSKKSMLMLVALFMLGACSTSDSNSATPHETWAEELGGKDVYATIVTGGSESKVRYTFTADASKVYESGDVYAIQSGSTATSAIYKLYDMDYYVIFYDFDSTSGEGKILAQTSTSRMGAGTFSFTAPTSN